MRLYLSFTYYGGYQTEPRSVTGFIMTFLSCPSTKAFCRRKMPSDCDSDPANRGVMQDQKWQPNQDRTGKTRGAQRPADRENRARPGASGQREGEAARGRWHNEKPPAPR